MPSPSPLSLQRFLPYRLSVTSNLVSDVIASAYESLFALKIPEWRLIAVIAEADGITQQAIGAATRMDKVTVSRAAIALIDRALVERRPHPADGRSRLLHLTETGRSLYDQVVPKALELEALIFGRFDPEALEWFHVMLHAIDEAAMQVAAAQDRPPAAALPHGEPPPSPGR